MFKIFNWLAGPSASTLADNEAKIASGEMPAFKFANNGLLGHGVNELWYNQRTGRYTRVVQHARYDGQDIRDAIKAGPLAADYALASAASDAYFAKRAAIRAEEDRYRDRRAAEDRRAGIRPAF